MNKTMKTASAVSVIPATKRAVESGGHIRKEQDLRVAAYCRVSTDNDNQQTSYTTQKRFYTEMISSHPGWILAGIYADEAISGTSRSGRKQFNAMMEDAMNGKMDYIVTKSISRFARNTVDTLNCVRQLRQLSPPVGVYFEKENIDTLDATGELILTILSALAQEESRSISDNIRWSMQKKFLAGDPVIDLSRFLGYDKGPDGEWIINEDEAAIVRHIYNCFLCGQSANKIASDLNEKGYKTAAGKIWRADAILRILRNEKYVGDLEMQKTITQSFLTHRSMENTGEQPKYYIENHHTGIIDRPTWDKVQLIFQARKKQAQEKQVEKEKKKLRGAKPSPFINLVCGEDGSRMVRFLYNNVVYDYSDARCAASQGLDPADYHERYYFSHPVWRCEKKVAECRGKDTTADTPTDGGDTPTDGEDGVENSGCPSGTISECALEQGFMEMLYRIKRDFEANGERSEIFMKFEAACEKLDNNRSHHSKERLDALAMQIREVETQYNKALSRQVALAREAVNTETDKAVDQETTSEAEAYRTLAEDLKARMDSLKKERDVLMTQQGGAAGIRKNYELFMKCLKELPEVNDAGMKMNVNGLDVQGSLFRDIDGKAIHGARSSVRSGRVRVTPDKVEGTADYLRFERGIYCAFVKEGVVKGDKVLYKTNFDVEFVAFGADRNLSSFLGFRRANMDGTLELLDEKWKVRGKGVCYSRRERGKKKKMIVRE